MARTVCVTINGHTYCTGSPIRDCSCERDASFKDAYTETPERIDDPNDTLADITRIFSMWSKSGDTAPRADKLYALSAITRLILTPGLSLAGPFVITSLQNADGTAPTAG